MLSHFVFNTERGAWVVPLTATGPQLTVEWDGEGCELTQQAEFPASTNSPVKFWYTDHEDREQATVLCGYTWDHQLCDFTIRLLNDEWLSFTVPTDSPALTLQFRDPQAKEQFKRLLAQIQSGETTHVLLTPLLQHVYAVS